MSHPIEPCVPGVVDKDEGSTQQRQNQHIEAKSEHVNTHPLFECPLSLPLAETLLLQVQLWTHRGTTLRPKTVQENNPVHRATAEKPQGGIQVSIT